ncbi:unnamed protein product, partial [marine sediment metagenome]
MPSFDNSMYSLELVTAPGTIPITLAEAKLWLKVENTDDDALITSIITGVTSTTQLYLQRSLITQTRRVHMDCFPSDGIFRLPYPPVSAVSNVKYYNQSEVLTTVSTDDYETDIIREPARVLNKSTTSWPTPQLRTNAVQVEYVAGYGAATTDIPEDIRRAMLLMI